MRVVLGLGVEPAQPGAEQEDQVRQEIAREQECGQRLGARERSIPTSQHDRTYLDLQQIREQRARQQDGKEIHQANEYFLWFEVHGSRRSTLSFKLQLSHHNHLLRP